MALSRKHYKEIAAILYECRTKDEIVARLTLFLKEDNPNFDSLKFLKAVYDNGSA